MIISKDEPELAATLASCEAQIASLGEAAEVVVVDASAGRLADIAVQYPGVRWFDYKPPPGVSISIPHQRNFGVRQAHGDLIVFTDAGCVPHPHWLERLRAAVRESGEEVVTGISAAPAGTDDYYAHSMEAMRAAGYVGEAPTLNLAFTRQAFDAVGGFDESFEYGSDCDFTWRLVDAGYRIRVVDAVLEHSWGGGRRQLKRAYRYGRGRARLYAKHPGRRHTVITDDPISVAYPAFILGLPLTLLFPAYPLLLLIPAWRARSTGSMMAIADHLAYGAGVLSISLRRIPRWDTAAARRGRQ